VPTRVPKFEPDKFLAGLSEGGRKLRVRAKAVIFAQGETSGAVFYIQKGTVKLNVLSTSGKEATIGLLGVGDFFGEGCLAGQTLHMESATAVTACDLVRIDKKAMVEALHREPRLWDVFVAYLLAQNVRYQEALVDQLFNSSEKRLARTLLLLANFGREDAPGQVLPEISQSTLAEIVGTTRSRVNFFLKKFKKRGFIHYSGGLRVHNSLLTILLEDESHPASLADN
jgi:CRP/FNR family cyclic AMP-dependent transcriptional regulator